MIVRARSDIEIHPSLTPSKDYVVIGLDHSSFRIINDQNEPPLYERWMFVVIDESIPSDWTWERYSDDEFYADPPGLGGNGFYERFFDDDEEAIERVNRYLRQIGINTIVRPYHAAP